MINFSWRGVARARLSGFLLAAFVIVKGCNSGDFSDLLFQGKPFAVLSQALSERKSKKSFVDRKNDENILMPLANRIPEIDPHADPHGETSGRKQWIQECRRPHPFGAKRAGKR